MRPTKILTIWLWDTGIQFAYGKAPHEGYIYLHLSWPFVTWVRRTKAVA